MKIILILSVFIFNMAWGYSPQKRINNFKKIKANKFQNKSLINEFESNEFLTGLLIKNKLQDFTSDGCSSFPDGTPSSPKKWQHCCVIHDTLYWMGGTEDERLNADQGLRECVSIAANPTLGVVMYEGVRIGGSPYFNTNWRWGYGWIYKRGYRKLTEEEKESVALKFPLDLEKIQITESKRNYFKLPSLSGNYCADEAIRHLKKIYGEGITIEGLRYKRFRKNASSVRSKKYLHVKISDCNEEIIFNLGRLNTSKCTRAIYNEVPPKFIKKVTIPFICQELK